MLVGLSQRNIRNHFAGGALAFGIVLVGLQLIGLILPLLSQDIYNQVDAAIYIVHVVGGIFGGYLVERRVEGNYLRTGIVIAVLAYIFEYTYRWIVLGFSTDSFALVSLLTGGIIGSVLNGWRKKNFSKAVKSTGLKSHFCAI